MVLACAVVGLLLALLTGCAPVAPAAPETAAPAVPATEQPETAVQETYQEITYPGSENVVFELPEGWKFWGNAGYLSPDEGKTLAGIRMGFLQEGKDSARMLYNEDAKLIDRATVVIDGKEVDRHLVSVTLRNASTGVVFSHTYEMLYCFPAPDGQMLAGIVFSAQSEDEVKALAPVAEHMIRSLQWSN
jgi:hypothetical protein